MLTILIPAAGEGRRFREAGYAEPKPLIPVRGVPMLRRVIDNVRPAVDHRWVFVARSNQGLNSPINEWFVGQSGSPVSFYFLQSPTDGAARTCLLARHLVNLDAPLLITNCDKLVEGGIGPLLETDADAAVLTMEGDRSRRWSYIFPGFDAKTGTKTVLTVIEKPDNSPDGSYVRNLNRATTGHYYFRRAGDFFAAAECMIALDDRTNGEFYVAPTLNYLIAARKKVVEVRVESYGGVFHGLGTPEDLKAYEEGKS